MKFNIMGFNQEILVNKYNNLNGNDLIVLRTMMDILPRMTRVIEVEGKEFKQLTYELLLEDVPFITQSVSTLKKMVQKFVDNNLIERYVLNKGGKFTYFRTTENLEELLYKEEVTPVKEVKKKKSAKKKESKEEKIEVLEVQIEVEEVIEVNKKLDLVNEIITVGQASIELKEVIEAKSIEEVQEIVEEVKLTSNGLVTSKYVLNAFDSKKAIEKTIERKTKTTKFVEHCPERERLEEIYNSLEPKLLGWDALEEVEEETIEDNNEILKSILAKAM